MGDRELVQRIKDATDLADLVGQSVKLRRQGGA
jgi:DNA primase